MWLRLRHVRVLFGSHPRGSAICQSLLGDMAPVLHPVISMGSVDYPPAEIGRFEVVGGLFGEPLEVAPCATLDLHVPAAAEIVIEGEILPGEREPEGPFGEFTGYFSRRSTEHVFVARAIARREAPWFQSIGSGRAGGHTTPPPPLLRGGSIKTPPPALSHPPGAHRPPSGASSIPAPRAIS